VGLGGKRESGLFWKESGITSNPFLYRQKKSVLLIKCNKQRLFLSEFTTAGLLPTGLPLYSLECPDLRLAYPAS